MSDNTKIEWTDATWNPITGCTVVSAGCKHCYAMKLAGTRMRNEPSRAGLTIDTKAGPVWNGEVRFNEQWLDQPNRWRKPRRIFVCAHGDLFHENVPDEWIASVWGEMRYAQQHTFQVLTKRPERMLAWLRKCADGGNMGWITHDGTPPKNAYDGTGMIVGMADRWPLPNVWLGVSVEDQANADERIPLLMQCPAAIRFLSCEPLLGPIDLCATFRETLDDERFNNADLLQWVICGGESGNGARPMHPNWARALRDQCAAAGVAFFHKQNGEYASVSEVEGSGAHYTFPDGSTVRRVGKKAAGRLLDGREHNVMPA